MSDQPAKKRPSLLVIIGSIGAILAFGGTSWTAMTSVSKLDFVLRALNPESVQEYKIKEVRRELIKELRWCFGKAKLQGKTFKEALDCLD